MLKYSQTSSSLFSSNYIQEASDKVAEMLNGLWMRLSLSFHFGGNEQTPQITAQEHHWDRMQLSFTQTEIKPLRRKKIILKQIITALLKFHFCLIKDDKFNCRRLTIK